MLNVLISRNVMTAPRQAPTCVMAPYWNSPAPLLRLSSVAMDIFTYEIDPKHATQLSTYAHNREGFLVKSSDVQIEFGFKYNTSIQRVLKVFESILNEYCLNFETVKTIFNPLLTHNWNNK